jgi:hypothetical protein
VQARISDIHRPILRNCDARHRIGARGAGQHFHRTDLLSVCVVLDDLIGNRVDDKEIAAVIQSDLEHWARIRGHVLPLGFEVKPVLRSGPTGAAQIVWGT